MQMTELRRERADCNEVNATVAFCSTGAELRRRLVEKYDPQSPWTHEPYFSFES